MVILIFFYSDACFTDKFFTSINPSIKLMSTDFFSFLSIMNVFLVVSSSIIHQLFPWLDAIVSTEHHINPHIPSKTHLGDLTSSTLAYIWTREFWALQSHSNPCFYDLNVRSLRLHNYWLWEVGHGLMVLLTRAGESARRWCFWWAKARWWSGSGG